MEQPLAPKIVARSQLQRHSSEVVGYLGQRQATLADRRIQDSDFRFADLRQHDEVVEVPVQDAGQLELAQISHVQPQWPGLEPQLLGDVNQVIELGALERHWMPLSQLR